MELIAKAVLSGIVVVAATEAAKRSSLMGAVLVSLPLTSLLALVWLYADTRDAGKVVDLSWSIMWIFVPSLAFFAAVPALIRVGTGVPLALIGACVVTAVAYAAYVLVLRAVGVDL